MKSKNVGGKRLEWVDQAKGLGIFLVIYAHNIPLSEAYIYSFHMPLFFFVAGMFHPKLTSKSTIVHRAKGILIPYFFWATFLYVFWYFLGRHYGDSLNHDLDPLKGLVGVFYAQGDIEYMDWGIPMWFLPAIFVTFCLYSFLNLIRHKHIRLLSLVVLIVFGLAYPCFSDFKLPWSLDVACVSLSFYALGNFLKPHLLEMTKIRLILFFIISVVMSLALALLNSKIDMYRAQYGNELLFLLNGTSGTLMVLLFFKLINWNTVFSYLGKNTILLLALHFRALTVIKAGLLIFGIANFNFDEPSKFAVSCLQVILILPVIFVVNKYIPLLNGKVKKA
ncbi:acyltransferase family protein [Hyunsoonleella sp. SJ7]|uniref:Acyltransferase family protein n=1 Tax=Hyunsoonleella aquatilis TaxID=2762758 RepID=A0A923HBX4_9FLAO|nr:acyltransferase family protein [Hyunsoonleella aquatilis]MBC3758519.1 acyltransferase family protein [Hyunsoonleella aquatilis]